MHSGKQAAGIGGSQAKADASQSLCRSRQSFCQRLPGSAAVDGFIQAAARPIPGPILPGTLTAGPKRGIYDIGIDRGDQDLAGAGIFILVEDFFPGRSAIPAALDSSV